MHKYGRANVVSCLRENGGQEEWPVLVVAPASLRLIWAEEVEKWLPGVVRPSAIHVVEGRADRIRSSSHPFQVLLTLFTYHSYLVSTPQSHQAKAVPYPTPSFCCHSMPGAPALLTVIPAPLSGGPLWKGGKPCPPCPSPGGPGAYIYSENADQACRRPRG